MIKPGDKDFLKNRWQVTIKTDGGYCPVCGRWGKVNPFRITGQMAVFLPLLYVKQKQQLDAGGTDWVDFPHWSSHAVHRSHQYPKYKWWGLIERKKQGYWRVTKKGEAFLLGKISVPKTIFVYCDKIVRVSDEQIKFMDVFGGRYIYEDAMQPLWQYLKDKKGRS